MKVARAHTSSRSPRWGGAAGSRRWARLLLLAAMGAVVSGCQVSPTAGDDHGDTRPTATSIAPAPVSLVDGQIDDATDVDYFGLVVTATSTVYAATGSREFEVGIETADHASPGGTFHDAATIVPGHGGSAEVYVRYRVRPRHTFLRSGRSTGRSPTRRSTSMSSTWRGTHGGSAGRHPLRRPGLESVVASGFPESRCCRPRGV